MRGKFALLIALAALAGCGDEDAPIEPPLPPPIFPTPDALMAGFADVYTEMDIAAYRDLILAEDYVFVFQPETVVEFELDDDRLDLADEAALTQHMFSGVPNADGRLLTGIEIQQMDPLGLWTAIAAEDTCFGDVPGAGARLHSVLFYFHFQGDFRYEMQGQQLFVVAPDTVLVDGDPVLSYRLLGQRDFTSVLPKAATDTITWSTLKALYL